jgi:hypothetical protein
VKEADHGEKDSAPKWRLCQTVIDSGGYFLSPRYPDKPEKSKKRASLSDWDSHIAMKTLLPS